MMKMNYLKKHTTGDQDPFLVELGDNFAKLLNFDEKKKSRMIEENINKDQM